MSINYQDKNINVMYLQIFLRDYFGMFVEKTNPKKKSETPKYVIVSNKTLRVTGYYNQQTYSALALYMFYNYPKEGYPYLWKEESEGLWVVGESATDETLIDVISQNIENLPRNKRSIEVTDRVMSYIFGEVVSESSSHEEILRVKKLLYNLPIQQSRSLDYDSKTRKLVEEIQQKFLDRHMISGDVKLPEEFEGFKVTGYVDPWTEIVIKEGEE